MQTLTFAQPILVLFKSLKLSILLKSTLKATETGLVLVFFIKILLYTQILQNLRQ